MTEVKLLHGDSVDVLKQFDSGSIDLIFTSPPYADQRKNTYGGIPVDEYVDWFLGISGQLLRVMKPKGTFVLNIKEHTDKGEKSTYVMELVMALREQGWLWTEEFIWHKKNTMAGKWPNRFRNAWEHLYQFNKDRHFNMYQEAVMVPTAETTKKQLKYASPDEGQIISDNGSGLTRNRFAQASRTMSYPSNVVHMGTSPRTYGHSAVFPKQLPEWFIKLFTVEGDWVLDPFAGSFTTCEAARDLNRNSIGIELLAENIERGKQRLDIK